MRATLAPAGLAALIASAAAAEAGPYENARFGYAVEIPKGFSRIVESDNSDGGAARSAEGDAELLLWGANLLDETFADDVRSRIAADVADGWSVSYRTVGSTAATWSGSKGGRIAYSRAIAACDGQAAHLRVEYDRASLKVFDPVVRRLAVSFKASGPCMRRGALAPPAP